MSSKTASCIKFSSSFFSKFYVFTILVVVYSANGFQPVIGRYLQTQQKIPSMSLNFFSNFFAFTIWTCVFFASRMVCFRRTASRMNARVKRMKTLVKGVTRRRNDVKEVHEHGLSLEEQTKANSAVVDTPESNTSGEPITTKSLTSPAVEPLESLPKSSTFVASSSMSTIISEDPSQDEEYSFRRIIFTMLVTTFFCCIFLFVRYTKSAANLFSSKFTSAVYVQLISITSPLFVSLFNGIIAVGSVLVEKCRNRNVPSRVHVSPSDEEAAVSEDQKDNTLIEQPNELPQSVSQDSLSEIGPQASFSSFPETPSTEFFFETSKGIVTPQQFEPAASFSSSMRSNSSSSSFPVIVHEAKIPPVDVRKIFTVYMAIFMLITCVGGILISLGSFSTDPDGHFTSSIQISFKNIENPMENLGGLSLSFYSNISNALYSIITASSTSNGKHSYNKFRMGVLSLSIFQSGALTVLFFIGARILREPIWIWGHLSGTAWMYLLIYAFSIYLVADSFTILAVKLVGSNNAMALFPTSLIFTLAFSAIFLGEVVSNLWQIIGCVIVMGGVIGFSLSKTYEIQKKMWRRRRTLRGLPPARSCWKFMFQSTTRVIKRKKRTSNNQGRRKMGHDFLMHSVLPSASSTVVQS
mmetsp:Transcript_7414/g.27709  ORF Transcript_7414/g.27709 Transcript_7414/m.27709 type:complete len:638 (-) Transcript_7414:2371-4284(-)